MEDDHILMPCFKDEVALFAIFDGHGGPEVAKYCSLKFASFLKQNDNFQQENYKKSLEEIFLKIDENLKTK